MSEQVAGSFRDPSGFVFRQHETIYRQINQCYKDQYDLLMSSGLYDRLVGSKLLVSHEEVGDAASPSPEGAYKVIRPEQLPFVSYPYEWSFSQLKDAALATLAVQKAALDLGMTLKDCSAYNIQFHEGRPVFIDTLSFEAYVEGMPWTPYKQFCQHFLAPLALMSLTDVRLEALLRSYIDGVPLDLASKLLPYRTRFSAGLMMHIHMHAKSQAKYSDTAINRVEFRQKFSKTSLLGLFDSLEGAIRGLAWKPAGTEWADYYSDDSYTRTGLESKQNLVTEFLRATSPRVVWDMGANNGFHSRIAAGMGAFTVAFDVDPAAVELCYLEAKEAGEANILPLLLDLTNPSPGLGWANEERLTVPDRGCADTAMALALIHHIAISNNVPFVRVAEYFSRICRNLIIEFVPKSDHKVRKLLATREDVFPRYNQAGFEEDFGLFFSIDRSEKVSDSERVLNLMSRK